jgi:hypothetical protein
MDGLPGIGVDSRAGTQQVHMTLSSEWVEAIRQSGKTYSAAIIHALAADLKGRITPLRAKEAALAAVAQAEAAINDGKTASAQLALAQVRQAMHKMYVG